MREFDFLPVNSGKAQHEAYEMLEELYSLSETLELYLDEGISCKPRIKWLEDSDIKTHLNLWSRPDLMENSYEVLEFSCTVPLVAYRRFSLHESESRTPETEWIYHSMISELSKQICDVLVCCNLSRIGSIVCSDSLVFENGEYQKYSKLPTMNSFFLQTAVELSEKIGWPKLHAIEFVKVWGWAKKNKGFLNGFGGGKTGRAFNAFSRLFALGSDYDAAEHLMWSLIGVEALYGAGRTPIMEQIREKAQTLLGKQADFKKKISEMYDFRSRFMHGDMDFPSLSFYSDAVEIYETFTQKQIDAVSMATAILIATLQEMIIRDWSGLEFTYAVSDVK